MLTGKLGKYQNQVTALSGAKFERYENIFKVFNISMHANYIIKLCYMWNSK